MQLLADWDCFENGFHIKFKEMKVLTLADHVKVIDLTVKGSLYVLLLRLYALVRRNQSILAKKVILQSWKAWNERRNTISRYKTKQEQRSQPAAT